MALVKPFAAIMPKLGMEKLIAALPYDVYNREEAVEVVKNNPDSFLRIDRAETNFGPETDTYADCVYDKAKELINTWIEEGRLVKQDKPMFYIYQEIMNGRPQTGIVGCASVADYENNIIKKHENTLAAKEADRIRHIDTTNMQTGPIFLAFRSNKEIDAFLAQKTAKKPYYDFISEDGITHKVWLVDDDAEIESVEGYFAAMNAIYIADGHHRCASACKVSAKRHIEGKVQESDFFMSVLFPENQLKIMDYNRVVKDLNGYDVATFLEELETYCHIGGSDIPVKPAKKGQVGMYLDGQWFSLEFKTEYLSDDPVEGLDVSILQKYVLDGMLDIKDPKNDKRIDFVGGIRGLEELERRVNSDCRVAFAMYPTDINELFDVADASRLMPPKSTWFEPKLRSGLFLHSI
ncbi:DUF1015 domain-containing protein [Lacrimispora saccharolytica]|uniref:DUF1015 domain-containing protein n=1 Tax=Lacrimispora saccharolytica TaxID=84030 RepID=UPI00265CC3A2|nr:DUF1015 family protein [Lacrimispora saccharolytica]MCF2656145.1 DUF1015 domain-containing protein [Lacrimispora saccharolytica]